MQDETFRFVAEIPETDFAHALVARVPRGITTKRELLSTLAAVLRFPSYFGENWDALFDCLRDFEWVEERQVVLLHEDVPLLDDEKSAATYLDILRDSVQDWRRPEEDHELIVIFPEGCRQSVMRLFLSDPT